MKVIFHVDEEGKWPLTLGNVKNMLAYANAHNENYKIEILANSEAVRDAVKESKYVDELAQLYEEGVDIALCHNALMAQGIIKDMLYKGCRIVPAGVVELAQKQMEGYAYIKP